MKKPIRSPRRSCLFLTNLEDRVVPAITGLVYQDFNANGVFDSLGSIPNNGGGTTPTAVDRGLAGVTVTAYDANNLAVATALSNALGQYSLNVSGSGPFRVEFTGLPTGVHFGPQGTTSGSAVQFVSGSVVSNVDLAVVRPEDILPNNPTIVTSSYIIGGITNGDMNPGSPVIVSFPYSAGAPDGDLLRSNFGLPTTRELQIQQRSVGATWGLAFDSSTGKLYASAFMKRTTDFGPNGPGAIYQMGMTGTVAGLYADLNAIFGDFPAGNLAALYTDINGNPVPFRQNTTPQSYWFRDGLVEFVDQDGVTRHLGWDAVGKTALGGLGISADGAFLYTVALGDRRMYILPTSGPLNASTVQRIDLPMPASVTGRTATNPLGDLRPFAVEVHRGIVYIGAVNSAESTQDANDLKAYVFAFDPTTGQFIDRERKVTTTDAILEFNLNYDRGNIHLGQDRIGGTVTPPDPAEWNPWSPVYRSVQEQPEALGRSGYPQPMLTGLSFDADGNLVIGLRDRSGDQFGRNVPIDPNEPNNFSYFAITAGDVLRAFINQPGNLDAVQDNANLPFAGWTLEFNGRNPDGTIGSAPQNTGQGPGGGEFYSDDDFPHDPAVGPIGVVGPENEEVLMGGVLQLPGRNQTLASAFDPIRLIGAVNGGGFRWFDNLTGALVKSFELYVTPFNTSNNTFAKGNGLGDLLAIAAPPPIEIGNYVWNDANRNGVQDAREEGLANVVLKLYSAGANGTFGDADDLLIATATTDANGNYIFSSGSGTTTGSRVYNLKLLANSDYQIRADTSRLSGTRIFTTALADGSANGTARDSNASELGIVAVHTTLFGRADHTFDIGVQERIVVPPTNPPPLVRPASVSGYVFLDNCPVDGVYDPTNSERGLAGVRITLTGLTDSGNSVTLVTTTNAAGFYQFLNLAPGQYTITETQPTNFYDGIDTLGSLSGTIPANDVLTVTLAEDQHGTDYNFAEIAPAALFGYVYEDANRNQRRDDGEVGVPGARITLSGVAFAGTAMARPLTAADSLGGLTAITDASGRWEFPRLPPGQYIVVETQPAGYLDYFESLQEAVVRTAVVGNDIFSAVDLCAGVTRGQLNFGEINPNNTKKEFLGSTTTPPSTSPPISTPDNTPLTPAFSVSTTTPTFLVQAAAAGASPLIRVYDYSTGSERFRFFAYEQTYLGGVRVATGDVDGDGIPDIITATGQGGGPRVRVFSGLDGFILRDFFAYESDFRGGVFVAAADVNGDGRADIITGTELGGGPRVTVFDAVTNNRIQDFFAFDSSQRGGVRVAAADFNNDGKADIVTTAGRGVQTRVRVFDAVTHNVLTDFVPYSDTFTGGVFIAAGDLTGDGVADIVTGADVGGGPHVQVFDGLTGHALYGFFADKAEFRGGVRLAMADLNGDGKDEIITGTGPGASTRIRLWQGGSVTPFEEFYAYDASYTAGVYVG